MDSEQYLHRHLWTAAAIAAAAVMGMLLEIIATYKHTNLHHNGIYSDCDEC